MTKFKQLAIYRYQHMLSRLSSSVREYAASDAESPVVTPFRFYFHFLHSELTEIKMFT